MLENASNMIHMAAATTKEAATIQEHETSNTKEKTKILTSKQTAQLATTSTILALPPILPPLPALKPMPATVSVSSLQQPTIAPLTPSPALPALMEMAASRTGFESLITKETTLTSTSTLTLSSYLTTKPCSSSSSLRPAAAYTSVAAAAATKVSFKVKEILQTLAVTLATTNVKYTNSCNSNNNNNNINNSNHCSRSCKDGIRSYRSKNIKSFTNENVSHHMIQENGDKNSFHHHHMLSLNHQNCTNVVQYKVKRTRPQLQQQCYCNMKQFLLLLTCFVAIITIFSLPQTATATTLVIATVPTTTVAPERSPTPSRTMAINETYEHQLKHTQQQQKQQQQEFLLPEVSYSVLRSSSSSSSPSDNVSKDNGNSYSNNKNNIKSTDNNDNSDNIDDDISTPYTPVLPAIATAIENSLVNDRKNTSTVSSSTNSIQRHYNPFENHIISRLIRSLDVSGSVTGVGSSGGISSIFSPSPGGGSAPGLTNIFNQNLDTGLSNNIECPSFDESSACPCYKFEDGLFLECPGTTATSLRTTLERISSPIHSLSIYDFDRSVTSLSQDVFQPGVNIRHLQFSHSHLETLKENSLKNVRASLESLSIVNGKLTQPPFVNIIAVTAGVTWEPRNAEEKKCKITSVCVNFNGNGCVTRKT